MSEPEPQPNHAEPPFHHETMVPPWTGRRQILARLSRLALKELRETLRDRRTIVTLVVMPLVLYPILALVFQRFLFTSLTSQGTTKEYVIGVDSNQSLVRLTRQLELGEAALHAKQAASSPDDNGSEGEEHDERPKVMLGVFPAGAAERNVIEANIHVAVIAKEEVLETDRDQGGLERPFTWELHYREGSTMSESAARYVESLIQAYSESRLDEQLKVMGVAADLPAASERHAIDFSGAPVFSLAALIPLILVLMTVTGAVYPAIDLTAGERERGTLEMLIAAPVPRVGLLLAKYVAVLAVALLTALVNLTGMAITSHSTGLNVSLFGGAGLSLPVVIKVLLLLGLFAAFFSAVLLAITSCARSFKEAQAYIIPLMLLCLVPGVVCLMPSLQFTGTLAVVPLVNIVLLARDLLEGSVNPMLASVAVVSTMFYVVAAIGVAAQIFGTDAILYGSQATWSDIFRRPVETAAAASLPAAAFVLAVMFPLYFVLSTTLARSLEMSLEARLLVAAAVTAFVFGGVPLLISRFNRVDLRSGLGLVKPGAAAFAAAALLGLVLWPAAHELFLLNEKLGIEVLRLDQIEKVREFIDQWRGISPIWILIALALVPGVFEELFFRGMLYSSLRAVTSPWRTIIISAIVFGLFHVVAGTVLAPERFLPSTLLGLVLGWVRHRTHSVVPCMALHAVHNGLLLSVAYWRDALAAQGIGIEEAAHLPATWLVVAAGGTLAATALLLFTTRLPSSQAS